MLSIASSSLASRARNRSVTRQTFQPLHTSTDTLDAQIVSNPNAFLLSPYPCFPFIALPLLILIGQDEHAATSYERARASVESGKFVAEIVPITVSTKKGDTVISKDEEPFNNFQKDKLKTLRPAFDKNGSVSLPCVSCTFCPSTSSHIPSSFY